MDESFKAWLKSVKPDVWIHHHHYMESWRSKDYDMGEFRVQCLYPLPEFVKIFKDHGGRGIIFSGSISEPLEEGDWGQSPYADSKSKVWKELQELSSSCSLGLSKVVIPNIIGPGENFDRLIPIMLKKASRGEALELKSPQIVNDHLFGNRLPETYREEIINLTEGGEGRIRRPSGQILTNLEFCRIVNEELVAKTCIARECQIVYPEKIEIIKKSWKRPREEGRTLKKEDWKGYQKWVNDYPPEMWE